MLEDLTARGYSVENQTLGLSYEQSKMAVEKLAFFHAASAMMLSENGQAFPKFTKGTFHAEHKDKLSYFPDTIRMVGEMAAELDISQPMADKLLKLPAKALQKAIEAYESDFKGFKVLNHGDFWTNNILFKYQGNELVDAIFVRVVTFYFQLVSTRLLNDFFIFYFFGNTGGFPKLCRRVANHRSSIFPGCLTRTRSAREASGRAGVHLPRNARTAVAKDGLHEVHSLLARPAGGAAQTRLPAGDLRPDCVTVYAYQGCTQYASDATDPA